jgi:hypothetical protein
MAKKSRSKGRKKGPRVSNDALNIAAIHWLAMAIEQVAMDVYVTDPDKFAQVTASLREQVITLNGIVKPAILDDVDCPDGWIECDGLCMPMCGN